MKRLGVFLLSMCMAVGVLSVPAQAAKYELKIQTALATSSLYFKTLERMKDNIEKLSGGEISVELFGEGAIVKSFEIFDAVSEDLINGGMCWTHWASGKHPAGTLFSAPCAGLGYGLDQLSQLSWMWEGDGLKLLNEFYQDACKMNLVAFPVLPMGPESFGWFHKRYNSLLEINKLTFRAPPGVPTEIFLDMGMPVVGLSGPDIIPSAQRGAGRRAACAGYPLRPARRHRRLRMDRTGRRHRHGTRPDLEALLPPGPASGHLHRRRVHQQNLV